jgi:hypothetical protein
MHDSFLSWETAAYEGATQQKVCFADRLRCIIAIDATLDASVRLHLHSFLAAFETLLGAQRPSSTWMRTRPHQRHHRRELTSPTPGTASDTFSPPSPQSPPWTTRNPLRRRRQPARWALKTAKLRRTHKMPRRARPMVARPTTQLRPPRRAAMPTGASPRSILATRFAI